VSEGTEFDLLVAGRPTEADLAASKSLRALIIPWAGLPEPTRMLLLKFPQIDVYNLHHNAAPTAELAVALMLAATKLLIPIDHSFRRHDWTPRYLERPLQLLEGRQAVILGFGHIGRRIAAACRALGMRVTVVRRTRSKGNHGFEEATTRNLDRLLPATDLLHVCLPLTPETRGLFGKRRLNLLPHGAVIVNVARGEIIEEQALYESLRARRLRAGLDVWYSYPAKADNRHNTQPSRFPFHELDTVVMTPHLGGNSDRTEALRIEHLAESINLAAAGRKIPNRVDVRRGY
jgi:phosphoglycerate dehydrogenase-like enzyme